MVIAERFRQCPSQELRRIRDFLGLDHVEFPAEAFEEEHVRYDYAETLPLGSPLRGELRRFYAKDVQRLRGLLGDGLLDWDLDFATHRPPLLLRPRMARALQAPTRQRSRSSSPRAKHHQHSAKKGLCMRFFAPGSGCCCLRSSKL